MKKIKQTSLIGSLPPEQRATVDRMLLERQPARAVQEYLAELGHELTTTSIYQYYHSHLGNIRQNELRSIAANLAGLNTKDLPEAIRNMVLQAAFELSLEPSTDPTKLEKLVKLFNDSERLKITRRQLELAETRAAEVLLDKAKSPEVQRIVNGDASHADKIAALRPLLFGDIQPITPTLQ